MRIKMPAVRIAQADAEGAGQDILTCGGCQKSFALADIVKFIQHKVLACNKENYSCLEAAGAESPDSDNGGGLLVNARRPSISAPIKKTTPGSVRHHSPAGDNDPRCSTPIKPDPDSPPRIKEELDITSSPEEGPCKKLRAEVADAESNTTHSEPSNYVCSTCKQRLHSAWRLIQHAQLCHGIRLFEESSSTNSSPGGAKTPAGANHSSGSYSSSSCSASSVCSNSSGNGNGGPTTPSGTSLSLPPPSRLGLPPTSPLVDPHMPLHHPFAVGGLLRMPLGDPSRLHQFPPTSVSTALTNHLTHHSASGPLFARPSSHDHFRMERLVSEQIRLNQQHALGLASAAAAVAAAGGVPPPHSPFPPPGDRPPILPPTSTSRSAIPPPPPTIPLSLEPQLDFYSQRLRQLAGTTSPGAANGSPSPSPRKLSPPFTSPSSKTPPATNVSGPSVGFNNNNNNNSITSNNNVTPTRAESATPPEKQSQRAETPANHSTDLSSTPRSASSPPANKPESLSTESLSAVGAEGRSHACDYCGKRFRFQSNLLVHRRTHTGEKPFKCNVCNHACTQSSKLKRHMKIHRRSNQGNGEAGGEGGAAATNGSSISTPDQISNAGSVETLDDDDEEDDEMDEEEDEEEEDEGEDMELEDEEGDEDDEGGDAPEDLTTKSTSSTPPDSGEKNLSNSQRVTPTSTALEKVTTSGSLVSELMDKFGLSNIQQYNEAYKQALQESVGGHHPLLRKEDILQRSLLISDNNNHGKPPPPGLRHLENGLIDKSTAVRFREDFAKNIITGQPSMDLVVRSPHGLFGHGTPFDNPFDPSIKRLKLDLENHHHPVLGRGPEHDNLYAGLWLPAMAAAHHREHMFGVGGDSPLDMLNRPKSNPDNILLKNGPKPGPSALVAAMNLVLPGQTLKKESRRNDTCEYCGKVFKNCSNLTVHRRSHTGEKPYKCELCSYACAQSSKLTRHMKTHGRLGKDVYRCRFCEMPFSVPSTLEKHMRKCVVNQNNKSGHILMKMDMEEEMKMHMEEEMKMHMLRMEDDMESMSRDDGDSSASASKDAT